MCVCVCGVEMTTSGSLQYVYRATAQQHTRPRPRRRRIKSLSSPDPGAKRGRRASKEKRTPPDTEREWQPVATSQQSLSPTTEPETQKRQRALLSKLRPARLVVASAPRAGAVGAMHPCAPPRSLARDSQPHVQSTSVLSQSGRKHSVKKARVWIKRLQLFSLTDMKF